MTITTEQLNTILENIAGNISKEIDLSKNKYSSEQLKQIMEAVDKKGINKVNLEKCEIDYVEISAIADVLKENKTITMLNLGLNRIGNLGLYVLSDVLKVNKTITTLNIRDNDIGVYSESIDEFAEVLKTNNTLIDIDISSNYLYGAVQLFFDMPNLTHINISRNRADPERARDILIKIMRSESNLQSVIFDDCSKYFKTARTFKDSCGVRAFLSGGHNTSGSQIQTLPFDIKELIIGNINIKTNDNELLDLASFIYDQKVKDIDEAKQMLKNIVDGTYSGLTTPRTASLSEGTPRVEEFSEDESITSRITQAEDSSEESPRSTPKSLGVFSRLTNFLGATKRGGTRGIE